MKNPKNDNFFNQVYKVVRLIPFGKVSSYGAIARFLGSPRSSRMVGWAMNKSFSAQQGIPAHRVVNRNGLLTGKMHFGTSNAMKQLLENEGIKVRDDQIINFKEVFWDPSTDLNIDHFYAHNE